MLQLGVRVRGPDTSHHKQAGPRHRGSKLQLSRPDHSRTLKMQNENLLFPPHTFVSTRRRPQRGHFPSPSPLNWRPQTIGLISIISVWHPIKIVSLAIETKRAPYRQDSTQRVNVLSSHSHYAPMLLSLRLIWFSFASFWKYISQIKFQFILHRNAHLLFLSPHGACVCVCVPGCVVLFAFGLLILILLWHSCSFSKGNCPATARFPSGA